MIYSQILDLGRENISSLDVQHQKYYVRKSGKQISQMWFNEEIPTSTIYERKECL